jgi:hypothetical protein
MPEIPSIDPCTNLKAEIEKQVHAFEQAGVYLKSQVTDVLKDVIDNYAAGTSTADALEAGLAGATVDDVDAGATAMSRVRGFAGSCLDGIWANARIFASNTDGFINDRLNDFLSLASLVEFDLLTPLRAVTTALELAGLEGLLAEIDKRIGCLADSEIGECTSLVTDFNDRIDAVLNYLGLNSDATFSLDTFQTLLVTNPLSSLEQLNLEALNTKMDELVAEASDNVAQIIPPYVNPESRY